MHKDIPVCIFDLQQEVVSAILNKNTKDHLPLPLKRIIHYKEEFLEEVRGDILILNEDGCALVDFWINDRTIPAHSCSLDDCYWTKTVDEQVRWDDVKLYG